MLTRDQIFSGRPKLSVLIDPDHADDPRFDILLTELAQGGVDYILLGGSTSVSDNIDDVTRRIKEACDIPILLFPGNTMQVSRHADALLLPSLISGRNAEYLIGKHVVAAGKIAQANIPVIPMGYILVDGGRLSSTAYMTQTYPIPDDKPIIAAQTALAGQLLGLQCIYIESGSGAHRPSPAELIAHVKDAVQIPVIVGGGISHPDDVARAVSAGADMIVIGTKLEQDPRYLPVLMEAFASEIVR